MNDAEARSSFTALFEHHHAAVNAYARRRCPAAAVDDVVAETFLVAWRRMDDIPADPLPWLLRVAALTAANARRGERRRSLLDERLAAEPPSVENGPTPSGLAPAVASALAQLGDTDRELLCLLAWERLTPAQAAAALDVSPVALRVRLHRARRRLRRALLAHGAVREPDPAIDHPLPLPEEECP